MTTLALNGLFVKSEIPDDLLPFFESAACGQCYVCKMVEVFREVRRVLRKDGTLWLNMGSSYACAPAGNKTWKHGAIFDGRDMSGHHTSGQADKIPHPGDGGGYRENKPPVAFGSFKPKDMIPIPWMLALALQADGWWLRAACPWLKRNAMPESANDRPTSAVEYLFLLTKDSRYFYDGEAMKVAGAGVSGGACFGKQLGDPAETLAQQRQYDRPDYPTRARRNSDWFFESWQGLYDEGDGPLAFIVNPAPYKEAHFATFPPGLVEPCIKAGTSEKGCCPKCKTPWRRVVQRKGGTTGKSWHDHEADSERGMTQGSHPGGVGNATDGDGEGYSTRTLGWRPGCSCGGDPVPCTVLDPFIGSGTTAAVALQLGRRAVGIELKPEYIDLAVDRIKKAVAPATTRSEKADDAPLFVRPKEAT